MLLTTVFASLYTKYSAYHPCTYLIPWLAMVIIIVCSLIKHKHKRKTGCTLHYSYPGQHLVQSSTLSHHEVSLSLCCCPCLWSLV